MDKGDRILAALLVAYIVGGIVTFGGVYQGYRDDCLARPTNSVSQCQVGGSTYAAMTAFMWPLWVPLYLSVSAWDRFKG